MGISSLFQYELHQQLFLQGNTHRLLRLILDYYYHCHSRMSPTTCPFVVTPFGDSYKIFFSSQLTPIHIDKILPFASHP